MRAARVLTLTMLAAAAASVPALAQDDARAPALGAKTAPAAAAAGPRLDLTVACETRDGLSLCVRPKERDKKPATRAATESSTGRFGRLTRLAGMFMGRVDAAQVGDFRLRFTLDLR